MIAAGDELDQDVRMPRFPLPQIGLGQGQTHSVILGGPRQEVTVLRLRLFEALESRELIRQVPPQRSVVRRGGQRLTKGRDGIE